MLCFNHTLHYKMCGGESGVQSSQNKLLINGAVEAGHMGFLPWFEWTMETFLLTRDALSMAVNANLPCLDHVFNL